MPLTREERKLLHQKSKQPTFGTGAPDNSEGNEGEVAYRQVADSGLVQYVKNNGDWVAVASSGEMPPVRIVGGGTSGSTGVTAHSSLTGLSSDDHSSYMLDAGTSVDEPIPRFNGPDGRTMQTSAVTIDDSNNIASANSLSIGLLTITTDQIDVSSGNLTLDVAADLVLSAGGTDITMDNGAGSTKFTFNLDTAPSIDITGAFTIDGSSTIVLDSVANTTIVVDGRSMCRFDTGGGIFFHDYAMTPSNFSDFKLNNLGDIYFYTHGEADLKQNYSMLSDEKEITTAVVYPGV